MSAPDRIGLALDPITNDVFLYSGQLKMVKNAEAVGQHIRQRLMSFENEWFLDTTVGVIWLSDILGKGYDPALAESVVKAEILDTEGVTSIESFSVSFLRAYRNLQIRSIEVMTDYDERANV